MMVDELKSFFKSATKSKFARNTVILTVGTTIAQFLPLIIYPILGRIYTPEQFGLLTSITSIVNILVAISTGNYESAVLIADSDREAASVVLLSLALSFFFLSVLLVPFMFFRVSIGRICGNAHIGYLVLLCPVSAFFINCFNCYSEWCVRKTYYKGLASNKITNSAAVTFGKLLFGFTAIKNIGLVIGDTIGRFVSAVGCFIRVIVKDKDAFRGVSYANLKFVAKKYIDFPKFIMTAQLLNVFGASVPILLLGAYFSSKEVGFFGMTTSVLSIPISIISNSVRDVFRQKANEIYIKVGHFEKLYIKVFKILSFVAIGGSLLVIYFLPLIFEFVLGQQWRTSGVYAQILLPMTAVDFVAMSLSGVLLITNKLRQNFVWQVYYTFITIVTILFGCIFSKSMILTLVYFCLGRLSAYIYLLLLLYKYSKGVRV